MATNGKNGGVSRRRLPVTKPMELPAEEPKPQAAPRLKVGDLVSLREGKGGTGYVRELARGKVLVYWGTADNREVTSWVATSALLKVKSRIVPPDEVIKRQAMQ